MDTKKLYTIIEKLSIINVSLKDVVPDKMVGDVTFETSITEDLALDSIEIMDVLLKIRENLQVRKVMWKKISILINS